MYVMHDCFIVKNKSYLPLRHTCDGEFTVREFGYKKKKFVLLLKGNLQDNLQRQSARQSARQVFFYF